MIKRVKQILIQVAGESILIFILMGLLYVCFNRFYHLNKKYNKSFEVKRSDRFIMSRLEDSDKDVKVIKDSSNVKLKLSKKKLQDNDVKKHKVVNNKLSKDEFFKTAVFIGDSVTQGLSYYNIIPQATFFCEKGINISTILRKPVVLGNSKQKITILQALKNLKSELDNKNIKLEEKNRILRVYTMFGLNGIGFLDVKFLVKHYKKFLKQVKVAIPHVEIYVQSMFPVTLKYALKHKKFSNKKIKEYNDALKYMCKKYGFTFIYVAKNFSDEKGNLVDEYSNDGIHFSKIKCFKDWVDCLYNFYKDEKR